MMNDYLDKVLAKTANDSDARVAFRKLRSRVYLATTQLQKLLIKKGKAESDSKVVVGIQMPKEEVMSVDMFADEINHEVGEVAFGIDKSYDWELAKKLVKGQKMMNDYLDKVLAKTANDSDARVAFRKLRSRVYLATQQL